MLSLTPAAHSGCSRQLAAVAAVRCRSDRDCLLLRRLLVLWNRLSWRQMAGALRWETARVLRSLAQLAHYNSHHSQPQYQLIILTQRCCPSGSNRRDTVFQPSEAKRVGLIRSQIRRRFVKSVLMTLTAHRADMSKTVHHTFCWPRPWPRSDYVLTL